MTYSIHDWTEDLYFATSLGGSTLGEADPDTSEVRAHLAKRFEDVHPDVPNPEWVIDRLVHSYDWILRHAHELDEPCVKWDGLIFSVSRFLCEGLYRICMRLPDSELGKDMDLKWLEELTHEQKTISKGNG